jgi:hypothetical protein
MARLKKRLPSDILIPLPQQIAIDVRGKNVMSGTTLL